MKIESRIRSTPDRTGNPMFKVDVIALWGAWMSPRERVVSKPVFTGVVVGCRPNSVVVRLDLPAPKGLSTVASRLAVRWEPEDRI